MQEDLTPTSGYNCWDNQGRFETLKDIEKRLVSLLDIVAELISPVEEGQDIHNSNKATLLSEYLKQVNEVEEKLGEELSKAPKTNVPFVNDIFRLEKQVSTLSNLLEMISSPQPLLVE